MRLQTQDFSKASTTTRPQNAGASMNDDASRLDAVAKVTGSAKYSRDRYLPNSLYVAFIRCPWGNADLVSIDEAAAKAVKGVVEVSIGARTAEYHGRNIGHLAAESLHAMRRGIRALNAQWKRKPVTIEIPDDADAPADDGADAILKNAAVVLNAVYTTPVQTHVSLETHGCCIDHTGDSAKVYHSTQGTFSVRDGLGKQLGLENSQFEVICEYVGGGFGSKLNGAGKEGILAAQIAAKHKRPVYLFVNRQEEHLDTGNRPSSRAVVRIGADKDGRIIGGQIATFGGVGVGGGGGTSVASGRYNLGNLKTGHRDVKFNAGGPRPMRAPGKPQGAFVEEMMIDEIAHLAGVDPLALRMKIVKRQEHRDMLTFGAEAIGWKNRQHAGAQTGVIRRGYGVGTTSWGSFGGNAGAEVVIHRDGSVEARTGTQDIGTGQRTIMGIAAANTLGVPLSIVTVGIGSSRFPGGPGSGGSVTAPSTVPPMESAAADARAQLLDLAAKHAGVKADELAIRNGDIVKGDKRIMSWAEACAKITGDSLTGNAGGRRQNRDGGEGHSDGAQFVELTVDTETGVVHVERIVAIQSGGRIVSRKTAESQVIGGVIQSMSFALFEQRVLDRNTGAMLNANMESYKILGPKDMPKIEPVLWTRGNQTGVRSIGEPPAIPAAGAIAAAVFNAIGRPVRSLPLTPDKVLAALAKPIVPFGSKGGAL